MKSKKKYLRIAEDIFLLRCAIPNNIFEALKEDCRSKKKTSKTAISDTAPSYSSQLSPIGETAARFMQSEIVLEQAYELAKQPLFLNKRSSCYTYYKAGDHLDFHKDDAKECEITATVCLTAISPHRSQTDTGLKIIFQTSNGPVYIPTHAQDILLFKGSSISHARPPLRKSEQVTLITACYTTKRI